MDLVGCSNDTSCYDNFIKENNFTIDKALNENLKKKFTKMRIVHFIL